jgi:hypothetical protein
MRALQRCDNNREMVSRVGVHFAARESRVLCRVFCCVSLAILVIASRNGEKLDADRFAHWSRDGGGHILSSSAELLDLFLD